MSAERGLSVEDVKPLLDRLNDLADKQECRSCDCFQGFLVQLELDATENMTHLTTPIKVPREQMHGCLGCAPCPTAVLWAEYIRNRMKP